MTGWLPGPAEEVFGAGATAEEAYGLLTVDVPAGTWLAALDTARTTLGCTFFDWLSAVDEPGTGFRVCAHVAALPSRDGAPVRRLLLRTTVPHEAPALPTAVHLYAGAAWHERETHEMFGIDFTGHPHLVPLLLPDGFEGHPLRKDFVLAARVAKAWPGAKEPGEPAAGAAHGGPKRRQMLPPGVPDPNEWGPLKGQLPPAPARPARAARATAGAEGERPVRRARSASEGSAGQATEGGAPAPRRARSAADGSASQAEGGAASAPRRARSAADGSASQAAEGAPPARRTRSASDGSASQQADGAGPAPGAGDGTPAPPRRTRSAADGSASQQAGGAAPARRARSASGGSASRRAEGAAAAERPAPHSSDAPWHHARPAFDEPSAKPAPAPETGEGPGAPDGSSAPVRDDAPGAEPAEPGPADGTGAAPEPRAEGAPRAKRAENDPDPAGGDPA
ncbi:NADH-quinone oxidoreductase subunit C [Streptomyces thioluteus]|uniref:NADH-quinone oxidoreductase subunit C n=1 Tax=Streptomyces thioluteus TaxID=66431 RepID=A0ABN3WJG0_STRTU